MANYPKTIQSLASSLNMNYLSVFIETGSEEPISETKVGALINNNLVRSMFEDLEYKVVAFNTGYEWSRWKDADIYLSVKQNPMLDQVINPFERMLLSGTPVAIFLDYQDQAFYDDYKESSHPKDYFIKQETFILDHAADIALINNPTFAFIHIMIPHPPMVFSPDGLLNDPGYFTGPGERAINAEYLQRGYIFEIQFINREILKIIDEIIAASDVPPIIIIQGDHGIIEGNPYPILNAYLFPGVGEKAVYPSISPVNSFRLLFSLYFGVNLEMLADLSISPTDSFRPIIDVNPNCQAAKQ